MEKYKKESVLDNESKETLKYEATIVIPSYKEGYGILRAMHSASKQFFKNFPKIKHHVVVVLNNNLNEVEKSSAYFSNLRTHILFAIIFGNVKSDIGMSFLDQFLEDSDEVLGLKSRIEMLAELKKMIKDIRESGVKFTLAEHYSSATASVNNNVALARQIGAEIASKKKNDFGIVRPFMIITDADTRLGERAVDDSTKVFYQNENLHGFPLYLGRDFENLKEVDKKKYFRHALHWYAKDVLKKIKRSNSIYFEKENILEEVSEKSFPEEVYLCGGGSVVSLEAFEAVKGFDISLKNGEDTGLGNKLSEGGFKIANPPLNSYPHLVAFTKVRDSDRTVKGFGESMRVYRKDNTLDMNVTSPTSETFYKYIINFFEIMFSTVKTPWNDSSIDTAATVFEGICNKLELKITNEDLQKIKEIFSSWRGHANVKGHHDFFFFVQDFLDERIPQVKFSDYLNDIHKSCIGIEYHNLDNYREESKNGHILLIDEKFVDEHLSFELGTHLQNYLLQAGFLSSDIDENFGTELFEILRLCHADSFYDYSTALCNYFVGLKACKLENSRFPNFEDYVFFQKFYADYKSWSAFFEYETLFVIYKSAIEASHILKRGYGNDKLVDTLDSFILEYRIKVEEAKAKIPAGWDLKYQKALKVFDAINI